MCYKPDILFAPYNFKHILDILTRVAYTPSTKLTWEHPALGILYPPNSFSNIPCTLFLPFFLLRACRRLPSILRAGLN